MTTPASQQPHNSTIHRNLMAIEAITPAGGFEPTQILDTQTLVRLRAASDAIGTLLSLPPTQKEMSFQTIDEVFYCGSGYLRQFNIQNRGLGFYKICGSQFSITPTGLITAKSPEHPIASPSGQTLPSHTVVIPSPRIWEQCLEGKNIYLGAHALYSTHIMGSSPGTKIERRPSLTEPSYRNWAYLFAVSATATIFHGIFSRIISHPDFPHEAYSNLPPLHQ